MPSLTGLGGGCTFDAYGYEKSATPRPKPEAVIDLQSPQLSPAPLPGQLFAPGKRPASTRTPAR